MLLLTYGCERDARKCDVRSDRLAVMGLTLTPHTTVSSGNPSPSSVNVSVSNYISHTTVFLISLKQMHSRVSRFCGCQVTVIVESNTWSLNNETLLPLRKTNFQPYPTPLVPKHPPRFPPLIPPPPLSLSLSLSLSLISTTVRLSERLAGWFNVFILPEWSRTTKTILGEYLEGKEVREKWG